MFVTSNQIYIFLACVAYGGVSGVIFSILFCVKKIVKNQFLAFTFDFISFIVVAFGYLLYSYSLKFSDFRIYMPIGVFIGILAYLKSFHILVAKYVKKIYNIIRKIFKKVNDDRIKSKKAGCGVNRGRGVAVCLSSNDMDLSTDSHKRKGKKTYGNRIPNKSL